MIPFLFNATYLSFPDSFYYLDFTPVSFVATGLIYFIGLFKFGMLDLVPIARAEIVKSMEDAVIVADCDGAIIDVNNVAIDLQKNSKRSAIGHLIGDSPFCSRRGLKWAIKTDLVVNSNYLPKREAFGTK